MEKTFSIIGVGLVVLLVGYFWWSSQSAQPVPKPNQNQGTPPVAVLNTYHNSQYGFSIQYPTTTPPLSTFEDSYIIPDSWSVFATPTSTGQKVVRFVVPKSNNVTAAELRVGVSTAADEVQTCATPPSFAEFQVGTTAINNQMFTVLSLSDAATSHYSQVHSYRIVHNTTCFVLDAFVTGTNPQVYDPPATPPFSAEEGFAQLDKLLQTFRFDQ